MNRFSGKMMDLYCSGVTDGTRVHQWEGANASSQLWGVEPVHDGRVKIKSNLAGKCLDLVNMDTENGAALQIWSDVNGDNQYWTIEEQPRKPKSTVTDNRRRDLAPRQKQHRQEQQIIETSVTAKPAARNELLPGLRAFL